MIEPISKKEFLRRVARLPHSSEHYRAGKRYCYSAFDMPDAFCFRTRAEALNFWRSASAEWYKVTWSSDAQKVTARPFTRATQTDFHVGLIVTAAELADLAAHGINVVHA